MNALSILVAPDSFKECLSALEVARALQAGLKSTTIPVNAKLLPLADGGEGTVPSLLHSAGGEVCTATVTGPLGNPVEASYGILDDGTAVMEMAAASGLGLVPADRRNPLETTTYGTGELLRHIVERGHERVIMGVGGSATVDAGLGALQALGVRLLDGEERELGVGGDLVTRVASLDTSGVPAQLREVELLIACDVNNPLVGQRGAATVFGPQKGASPAQVRLLLTHLDRVGRLFEGLCECELRSLPGAGAAGGLPAALRAVIGAELRPGVDVILDAVRFEEHLADAELVVTGEGRFDQQTSYGKVAAGVARRASKMDRPVVVVAGELSAGGVDVPGVSAVVSIQHGPMTLDESMRQAAALLEETGRRIVQLVAVGLDIPR